MPYTIYISDHCSDCINVLNFVTEAEVKCQVVNVDKSKNAMPVNIFIIPALTKGEKLLAYGEKDIVKILTGQERRA